MSTGVDIKGKKVDFKATKGKVIEFLDNPKPRCDECGGGGGWGRGAWGAGRGRGTGRGARGAGCGPLLSLTPFPSVEDKARLVLLYLSAAPDADDEIRRHFSNLDGVSNDIKNALVNIKFVGVTHQKAGGGRDGGRGGRDCSPRSGAPSPPPRTTRRQQQELPEPAGPACRRHRPRRVRWRTCGWRTRARSSGRTIASRGTARSWKMCWRRTWRAR